ncbi:SRPBCC domain-containing protein [Streptomyces violascens]|uniref:SRPBCC domain-containing protein n=1 Tax=Streptomyces violascens TaxID=67381 RepID=UPI0036AE270B
MGPQQHFGLAVGFRLGAPPHRRLRRRRRGGHHRRSSPGQAPRHHWAGPDDDRPNGPSTVAFDLKPLGGTVQLTVTHENLRDEAELRQAAGGWSRCCPTSRPMSRRASRSLPMWS